MHPCSLLSHISHLAFQHDLIQVHGIKSSKETVCFVSVSPRKAFVLWELSVKKKKKKGRRLLTHRNCQDTLGRERVYRE